MVGSLLALMLIVGANPASPGCVGCGSSGAFTPLYCPHRQLDDCPGQEVYAQTSPHKHHPAQTGFIWRYTNVYGINYSRPRDYRLLYDYPWYKRGDNIPHYTAEQMMEAQQEEWIPEDAAPASEYMIQPSLPPTSSSATNKSAKRMRSALSTSRAAHK